LVPALRRQGGAKVVFSDRLDKLGRTKTEEEEERKKKIIITLPRGDGRKINPRPGATRQPLANLGHLPR